MEYLFNRHTILQASKGIEITERQRSAISKWKGKIIDGRSLKETEQYYPFRNIVLEELLGYDTEYIDTTPSKSRQDENIDFQVRGTDGNTMLFIEAKEPGTRLDAVQSRPNERHDTPVNQLWDYMTQANPPIRHGICTNYDDFWLFLLEKGVHAAQKFRFSEIKSDDDIKTFVWLFKDMITGGRAASMHESSVKHDRSISEEFYKVYHGVRADMIAEFMRNDAAKRREAISTAQLFLNRLVFVFFAEDLGLSNGRLRDDIEKAMSVSTETSSAAYYRILDVFDAYNRGDNGMPEFNGGLFSKDINRNMRIRDRVHGTAQTNSVIAGILKIAAYNFETELNVNILGHIFEQSISDLEEGEGSERKDEGIFYTPDSVTEYICHNAIIPCLSRSGKSVTPAELLDEYNDNLGELERRLLTIRILDPACGSGAFLVKAAEVILDIHRRIRDERAMRNVNTLEEWIEASRIRDVILHNIYGVDKSEESVGITKLALFLKTAQIGEKLPTLDENIKPGNSLIRNKEAVSNAFDWEHEFPEIMDNDDAGFDVIIGNPPYIRQEKLGGLKEYMQLPEPNNIGTTGFTIPATSDILAYFFCHLLNLLKNGGRLGFIVANGWMTAIYGDSLKRFLLDYSHIEKMVKPKENVFEDAQTKSVIVVLSRGGSGASQLASINTHAELGANIPYRDVVLDDVDWNRHFVGTEFKTKCAMVKMSDRCKVRFGTKTGYKEFFVLDRSTIESYGISEKFLAPLVSNQMRPGLLSMHNVQEYMLDVNESKGSLARSGEKGMLHYIEDGEKTVVSNSSVS